MGIELKQYRDPKLAVTGRPIGFYEREFYALSNFSSFQVDWRGRRWPTSEHAYQAAHFFATAPDLAERIFRARSAHDAFKLAKANADKAPADWSNIKTGVMEDICRHKLKQNDYVRLKLLQTRDLPLVEDSPTDDFWGWGPNQNGRNELGKIWMKLRAELR
jgi:hypothetical protein